MGPLTSTSSTHGKAPPLPTLGWLDSGAFIPLHPVTLKSFMDIPVRSWEHDFSVVERERYMNLKCLLPSGRVLSGLVPIVREFETEWGVERRVSMWEDGRRAFRVENVVERYGLMEAFDIDPIPTPCFTPTPTVVYCGSIEAFGYGGWTDTTYVHVIPPGDGTPKVSIRCTPMESLEGVTYNAAMTLITSMRALPEGVPRTTREDVRITTWNCRGIPRATFRPNLYTLRSMTDAAVVVLTDTRSCGTNAREILNLAHGLNYRHTDTLGFFGGMTVLWDISKVWVYGVTTHATHVSFRMKVRSSVNLKIGNVMCVTT